MNVDSVKASYRRAFKDRVTVRRYVAGTTGNNRPHFDVENIQANVTGYAPHELVGTIAQGDRKILAMVDDLIAAKFALPLTSTDKLVVDGKEIAIQAVDGSTRQVNGVLICYEIQARG